jgi:hypothetical protein
MNNELKNGAYYWVRFDGTDETWEPASYRCGVASFRGQSESWAYFQLIGNEYEFSLDAAVFQIGPEIPLYSPASGGH